MNLKKQNEKQAYWISFEPNLLLVNDITSYSGLSFIGSFFIHACLFAHISLLNNF